METNLYFDKGILVLRIILWKLVMSILLSPRGESTSHRDENGQMHLQMKLILQLNEII